MKLKLYKYQKRTNILFEYDDNNKKNILDFSYYDYIFIVENDINKKYFTKHRTLQSDKNSYIELSIENGITDGEKILKKQWSLNTMSLRSRIIIGEDEQELNDLFKKFQREQKLNRILEE